jgi:hypothetical protein
MNTEERIKYLERTLNAMNRDIIIAHKTAFAFGGNDAFEEWKNLCKLQLNLRKFIHEQKEKFAIIEVSA